MQGTPLSNCYEFLHDISTHALKAFDITSGKGEFTFSSLEAGDYKFYADYKGIPMDEFNPVLTMSGTDDTLRIIAVAGTHNIRVEKDIPIGIRTLSDSNFKFTRFLPENN